MNNKNTELELQKNNINKIREIVKDRSEKRGKPFTFCVTTFGCQMNARDSEKLRGILVDCGYEPSESENCDLVVYNTCTVRENADNKVYGRLGVLNGYKKKNREMKIVLCGCMMQQPEVIETIRKSYHFVDVVFGTFNIYKFPELLLASLESKGQIIDIWDEHKDIVEDLPSIRKYPFKSGVNIMFGCNNFCTYCIVPYVRGRERSRRPIDIIRECEMLVEDGVQEIMLLGQNVNSYGKGLAEEIGFAELLDKIAQIDGLNRIRFMTSHPKDLSDELIEVMAKHDNIAKHFHLPLQSGSDRMLKAMNRHYTKDRYLELAEKLRKAMPDIAITTDIIVGFPGETEEDFLETLDVVEKVRYDSAFTFIYSKRTGTPAASMDPGADEATVKERFNRLLERIHVISTEQSERFVGKRALVLAEQVNEQDESLLTGRMDNNSLVHFPGNKDLIGRLVEVDITESKGFYYMGKQV